jgi:hypothetical protein
MQLDPVKRDILNPIMAVCLEGAIAWTNAYGAKAPRDTQFIGYKSY